MPHIFNYSAAEYSAADGLIGLSQSCGGFCLQQLPPHSPPPPGKPTRATAAEGRTYPCSVCGDTFKSPQALGGHKTRHRPKPTKPASTAARSSTKSRHVSSGRGRVFRTGQSLARHQRKDCLEGLPVASDSAKSWSGRSLPERSREITNIEEDGGPQASGGRGLDIDLNLPYPSDE